MSANKLSRRQFTVEVVSAADLTIAEDKAAWATGAAIGTAATPFLLIFGPAIGYYAGKSVHKKTVKKKVMAKLAQDGELRNILRTWNEGFFRERGLQTWLEPPDSRQFTRFRILIMPFDGKMAQPTRPASSPTSPTEASNWNGQNPNFGKEHEGQGLLPRRSYEAWKQIPKGYAELPSGSISYELPSKDIHLRRAELDGDPPKPPE